MPVISHKLKLAYFDIPKVACTTLKTALWEIENGREFEASPKLPISDRIRNLISDAKAENWLDIHDIDGYRTLSYRLAKEIDIPSDYDRITVLRDPIARFYSAWSNKANWKTFSARGELYDLENEGLAPSPSFPEFLREFERYRAASRPVRVHTFPYAWHLGPDLSPYDKRFKLEKMGELEEYLSQRAGVQVSLPKANRTVASREPLDLSAPEIDKLIDLTKEEYAWLDGLYDQSASLERLLAR